MNLFFADWEHVWETAGWTMLHFLWLGTAVAVCGVAIRLAARRSAPTLRYAISWTTFAILAALPIAITAWLSAGVSPSVFQNVSQTTLNLPTSHPPVTHTHTQPPSLPSIPSFPEPSPPQLDPSPTLAPRAPQLGPPLPLLHNLATHLPWLWLIGAPLTFGLLATGLIGAERFRRRSRPVESASLLKTCELLCRALRISRRVGISVCDSLAQPVLVGIVRPLILLPPAALTGWSPEQLEMVLVHELAHVRRWDNLANFVQRVVESLLFFHPAVWIVSRQIRLDREECCDAAVVAHTAKPQAYAELLVTLATSPAPLVGLAMARHPLSGRIRRILKLEDEPMLVSRNTLGWMGIALASLLAVAFWQPVESSVAEEADVAAEEQEVVAADDAEKQAGRGVPDPGSPAKNPRFLTPEDQRAADQIYKQIGLDLEPLTEYQLKRAKSLGFEGGLRVASIRGGAENFGTAGLLLGNTLVGLHVHGTPTLQEARDILLRERSSPMKFYAVLSTGEAKVFSGRIVVKEVPVPSRFVTQSRHQATRYQDSGPVYHVPRFSLTQPTQPPTEDSRSRVWEQAPAGQPAWPTAPTTPSPAIRKKELKFKIRNAEQEVALMQLNVREGEAHAKAGKGNVTGVEVQRREIALSKALLQVEWLKAQLNDIAKSTSPRRSTAIRADTLWPQEPGPRFRDADPRVQPSSRTALTPSAASFSYPSGPPSETLLYNGKTFEQWRSKWKNELKTEKRTECVKALAAFGRAGKGKEAAEAIMEVAKQYDFGSGSKKSVLDLKLTIVAALAGYDSIPERHWLALFAQRLKDDPRQWSALAEWILKEVRDEHPEVLATLKSIAKNPEYDSYVRGSAIHGLLKLKIAREDQEVIAIVREALSGKDGSLSLYVLNVLKFKNYDKYPEMLDLVFHADDQIRNSALYIFRRGGVPHSQAMLSSLISTLDDPQRTGDHENAIRAIDAMNTTFDMENPKDREKRTEVIARLEKILVEGDRTLLPETFATLARLVGANQSYVFELIQKKAKITEQRKKELVEALRRTGHLNEGSGSF